MRCKTRLVLIFFLVSVFLLSCGYRLVGSGNFVVDVRRIYIEIFNNRTFETGMENFLTNDIIREFIKGSKVKYSKKNEAEAFLSGVIKSVGEETISHTKSYTSYERRIKILADVKIVDREGDVLWSASNISAIEDYEASLDQQTTERNKKEAISELSRKLAENIYGRLTQDF